MHAQITYHIFIILGPHETPFEDGTFKLMVSQKYLIGTFIRPLSKNSETPNLISNHTLICRIS